MRQSQSSLSMRVFTRGTRIAWISLAILTVLLEVIPIPAMSPIPFYGYCAGKAILFLLVGYGAPLAFWRFNALNRGIVLAAFSACFVETLQGLLRHGHSFHWYELGVKLFLILFGFACALNARYDRRISFGPFRIRLVGEHT